MKMEVLSVQNQFQGQFSVMGSAKVKGKFLSNVFSIPIPFRNLSLLLKVLVKTKIYVFFFSENDLLNGVFSFDGKLQLSSVDFSVRFMFDFCSSIAVDTKHCVQLRGANANTRQDMTILNWPKKKKNRICGRALQAINLYEYMILFARWCFAFCNKTLPLYSVVWFRAMLIKHKSFRINTCFPCFDNTREKYAFSISTPKSSSTIIISSKKKTKKLRQSTVISRNFFCQHSRYVVIPMRFWWK